MKAVNGEPVKLVPGYWGIGTLGLSRSRDVYVCEVCGIPAQVTLGDHGVPHLACPIHGRMMPAPGMQHADVAAMRNFFGQIRQVVDAADSILDVIDKADTTRPTRQARLGGDGDE